jgi:ankyrin repeat protein
VLVGACGVRGLLHAVAQTTHTTSQSKQRLRLSCRQPCCKLLRRGWLDGIKLLLVSGAAVDAPNKKGLSALGEAVAEGHTEAAEALLAAGASATWRAEG